MADNSERPIFIVGAPRSGTTLMRSIIDAHPRIFCPFWETGFFVHFDQILNGDLAELLAGEAKVPLSRDEIVAWARTSFLTLMASFGNIAGKPRFAEKTPAHVYSIRLIDEFFPDAQFIHMIRNGFDVVRSLKNMPWTPNSVKWGINRWKTSVLAGREAGCWLGSGRYIEVRYEDLITAPSEAVRRLCDFLGEPFSREILEFHLPQNNSWHIQQNPISRTPINRHRGLDSVQRLFVKLAANSLLKELGYT